MPLATGQHTVLVFKKIQFLGSWTRFNGASGIIYTANTRPTMRVVVDTYSGALQTYFFTLKPADDVWVMYGGDAQVHIPALCQKSAPGDLTTCGGK
jgi:hypothetical protein